MKSLLDIQKDIRNLENGILELSADIKRICDDVDEIRNRDCNTEFDYAEIKKAAKLIPFKKHPICKLSDERAIRLYLEMLVNIVKFDDKNSEDKTDTRLVFIQWLLNNAKTDISLEELIINSFRDETSVFDEITSQLNKKYKEFLAVDLLITANMNGTFNADECNYAADILSVLNIDTAKLKILSLISKMVLCQKVFEFDNSLGNDLIRELGNYKHYVLTGNVANASMPDGIIKEAVKAMRTVVVEIRADEAKNFKWNFKPQEKVAQGDVVAVYQKPKRKRGYSFSTEYTTKEIIAPVGGTIFQFRDNNVIYGVIAHESDTKDSVKQWIKNERR